MTWGRGSTSQWRRTRALILDRDHNTCRLCGATATEVDHIVSIARGGDDNPPNLRALCARCHRQKTLKEAADGRRARADARRQATRKPHPGLKW